VARSAPETLLALAEALVDAGWPVEGINLGWELRDAGLPWDRRLLGVVFPFPYREIIVREAEEWGLDPILMASLVRQESAFKRDIRSAAGAVGLMQVMPATGAGLARRLGPAGFRESHLEVPEVNLHLGAAFYRDMSRRYDGRLTLVLSAYNAGPARADRWRRYAEAADPARFVERIPFDETRGYVKNVRRNLAVYGALYGRGRSGAD
jgi:soluble lytic murein transglycosylase